MPIPLKTFIIYARADTPFKDELLTHLHPFVDNLLIEKWVDSDLLPGEDWEKRIEKELEAAHLILMLVSADALQSEFIRKKELKTALEKKRDGSARVVPILVRDCFWKLHPDLSEIQLLPKDENGKIRGVAGWLSRDSAWSHCCEELYKLILEINAHLEREAAANALKAAQEAEEEQAAAAKAEKARHRSDEAAWKRISAEARESADPEHQLLLYNTYLDDPDHRNHREAAEDLLADIQAELAAQRKLEAAKEAAQRKKAEAAEAEAKRRQEAAAEEKRRQEAARKKLEEQQKKEAADKAAKAKQMQAAALQKGLPEMVPVQGGSFQMGEKGIAEPVHSVTLSDFSIGKYPVTQKLWQDVMGSNPSHFKGDDLPVENVSWNDVQDFLQKINAKFPGHGFRLPTEAEWEYAARGGALSKGYQYAGSNHLQEVGWFYENSGDKPLSGEWKSDLVLKNNCRTHPVGQKKANELGLYDMSGNVWEWCADWYGDYAAEAQKNPEGSKTGASRVDRGGSWSNGARLCRVAIRNRDTPGNRGSILGFRLASSPQ